MTAHGIYLIGFSGTGKTTVAGLVAERLGWPAHDLDRMIVAAAGMDIPTIFIREGELGFRDRETLVLREVAAQGPFVAATGGGLPLREENRQIMASSGWVVTLEGRPETLHARLERQQQSADPEAVRPLLAAAVATFDNLRELKAHRQPIYALADWTVHTDRLSPVQVADEVVRAVKILDTLV
jgi:shikimate kinase